MTNEERVARAAHAARLLSDDILTDALDTLERDYVEQILACGPKDDLGRFRFTEAVKVVHAVRDHIQRVVDDGQMAQREIKSLNSRGFF